MINLHYDIITVSPMKGGGYGAAMMQKRIKNCLEREKNAQDPHQELKNYLEPVLAGSVLVLVQFTLEVVGSGSGSGKMVPEPN